MSDYSSDDDNFYGDEGDEEEDQVAAVDLTPCSNCGRNFNTDVLPRHYGVCVKLKTRTAFDSKKQRLDGLEKIPVSAAAQHKPVKKKNWRWQHQQFIKNIRAARESTDKSPGSQGKAPSPTVNPDYIPCPYCKRRFNESAAERHISFCKEQQSRIPKATSDSKYEVKKEKQLKRSTYRPPLPGQKKKSMDTTPGKQRNNSSSGDTPGKQRNNSSSAPLNQRSKTKSSPVLNQQYNINGDRRTTSDTTISAGQRKKKSADEGRNYDERPFSNTSTNSRYSKSSSTSRVSSGYSLSGNDSDRGSSGKIKKGSEPKWFEDLKRNDSGNERKNKFQQDIDAVDSGMDLNENYPRTTLMSNTKNTKESPVGVVRPSSRTKENDIFTEKSERTIGSGRRKMANFCHDCGTKYPVQEAKFCCECGVKRMAFA